MKCHFAEFWMADCVRRWWAKAIAKFKEDPMLVRGNRAKETVIEYNCPLYGKLKLHIETELVGHGPGSGNRFRYRLETKEEA